jgi:CheY-like chemotaxis protein
MSRKQILVVDDEAAVLEVISRVLWVDHHLVETSLSGRDALSRLAATRYDLVIVDLNMPAMRGDELVRQIVHDQPTLPIILMTGSLMDSTPAGVSAVLVKPFSMVELREKVRRTGPTPTGT